MLLPAQSPFSQKKQLLLLCVLLVLLTVGFWAGSRYPALNEKAMLGVDTELSALGFDTLLSVPPDASLIQHILTNTLNWLYTNQRGMSFGLLFAAVFMTLLAQLPRQSFQGRFANTLLGVLIGAPLGVCVNCATPIAQGIRAAGGRVETMLATMMSSPSLNIIVLTLLFSLFPFHLAIIKIGVTLGVILIGIPLFSRFLPLLGASGSEPDSQVQESLNKLNTPHWGQPALWQPAADQLAPAASEAYSETYSETWAHATLGVTHTLSRNLWFIIKMAVPLMIVAGLLGSTLITLLPFESLADMLPKPTRVGSLLSMGALALIGLFLPVPMAFDILVSAILLQAGLPVRYVMVLLFTLGIFSVYPFLIVWKAISPKGAISLFLGLAGLGVVAGGGGHVWHTWEMTRQKQQFYATFAQAAKGPHLAAIGRTQQGEPDERLVPWLRRDPMPLQPFDTTSPDNIAVSRVAFQSQAATLAQAATPGPLFQRFAGSHFGLNEHDNFSILKFRDPLTYFRGIAAGDVHNDGWQDLVVTSDIGLAVYANQHGRGYIQQRITLPELSTKYVVNAALIDLNNDGWLDLFFSTYRAGTYVVYNTGGRFRQDNLHRIPNHPAALMSAAPAFGDLDQDGDLDIVLGNWSYGNFKKDGWVGNSSRNVWLENQSGAFVQHALPGIDGETLSTLVSDFDQNGSLDLIVGNDFEPPDIYYLGDGTGHFQPVTREQGRLQHSATLTMSLATADINNDLVAEIYVGQVSRAETPESPSPAHMCEEMAQGEHQRRCVEVMGMRERLANAVVRIGRPDASKCVSIVPQAYHEDCIALSLLMTATREKNPTFCELFPDEWQYFSFICKDYFLKWEAPSQVAQAHTIPQIRDKNILLMRNAKGRFVDQATPMGLDIGGWTWNAKFADVDNDGWQDLYIVNGMFYNNVKESNYFYANQHGQRFLDQTEGSGLGSLLDTSAYTYTDMDNDGDLDIVSVPTVGPVWVHVNTGATGNAIAFALRDHKGNHFGIGSTIIIHYGPDETRHQMREIQAGGGFISFDAPVAYFGLGDVAQVSRVEVLWSTGERSVIRGNFAAGARYIVTRHG